MIIRQNKLVCIHSNYTDITLQLPKQCCASPLGAKLKKEWNTSSLVVSLKAKFREKFKSSRNLSGIWACDIRAASSSDGGSEMTPSFCVPRSLTSLCKIQTRGSRFGLSDRREGSGPKGAVCLQVSPRTFITSRWTCRRT